MIQLSPLAQQIVVGLLIAGAIGFIVRWRIKSAKTKSGACPKCTIEH